MRVYLGRSWPLLRGAGGRFFPSELSSSRTAKRLNSRIRLGKPRQWIGSGKPALRLRDLATQTGWSASGREGKLSQAGNWPAATASSLTVQWNSADTIPRVLAGFASRWPSAKGAQGKGTARRHRGPLGQAGRCAAATTTPSSHTTLRPPATRPSWKPIEALRRGIPPAAHHARDA